MKTNKNKILVLTDFNRMASATLNNTLGIAKKMDANVEMFHVKSPLEVIQTENPLLAKRSLNRAHINTQKSFEDLISSVDLGAISVRYSYSVGRLKKEIKKKLEEDQPDMVVLGKRLKNPLKLYRDGFTNFIIKSTNCPVMIASSQYDDATQSNLVPAFYNDSVSIFSNFRILGKLKEGYDTVREYKIVSKTDKTINETDYEDKKRIQFVFERSDNAINTLSSYLTKNNINLFFVQWENQLNRDLRTLIDKVEVPVLIAGKHRAPITFE
ncbi:MAG: universal stress protein [Flavobacteriaceae bacterium]|nr:universal stress protein [Flavobacteriaceae bacterium]